MRPVNNIRLLFSWKDCAITAVVVPLLLSSKKMIAIIGTARYGDGEIERLQDEFKKMVEATRKESGCICYNFAVDVLERNVLRISELWESQEALDAHFQSAHMAVFKKVLDGAKVVETRIEAFEASNGRVIM